MLGWLVDQEIDPHIPVWDKGARQDGSLSRTDFTYHRERDVYHCPRGKTLKTTGRVHGGKTRLYRSNKLDCDTCRLNPRCCPTRPSRKIPRDVNEDARDLARALMTTDAYRVSGLRRKRIETLFGEAKRTRRLDRLRLRGLTGARATSSYSPPPSRT